MESRGISQVSAMILAMVSNVEDMVTLWLIWSSGQLATNAPEPRAIAPKAHFNGKQLGARIAKRGGEFNGGGYLARFRACIGPWNWVSAGSPYQRSFVTSTGVQPRRPDRTQSWFLRIAAIVSASQRPTAISPITKTNAMIFTTMRCR